MTRVFEFKSKFESGAEVMKLAEQQASKFENGRVAKCVECDQIKPLFRGGYCRECWGYCHD